MVSVTNPNSLHHFTKLEVFDDHVTKYNTLLKDETSKSMIIETKDIYLIYRKEAIEMTRLASQLFKAAAKAYKKKDHVTAKQHSLAAREKLRIAQEQNIKAAEEIFKINNRKNKIWRIDLHGLHGSEAIQALQCRLNAIEKSKPLVVITGVGKHSLVKPVLPIMVNNFLKENKYKFEEIRPGSLKVWPNSHHIK